MKQIIFLFLSLSFFLSAQSFAQQGSDSKLKIRAGAILGLTAAQVDGDDWAGYHKVGITGGFVAQVPISKKFFFSTEILYVQKGAKSPTYMGLPLDFKWNLSYAEIPVLFHYQEKKAFNFGIGASFGRLVSQYQEVKQLSQPDLEICVGKIDRVAIENTKYACLRRNDYSVLADMSYLFSSHFSANVRFSYSVIPMGYYGLSNFVNRGSYNNTLYFRAIYLF